MSKRNVVILLFPKFKATHKFEAKEILKSLGMQDAFIKGVADFSGIDGKKNLYIDKVFHKAFVNVDEKGTEAAAASAVVMKAESAVMNPFRFLVRHPFLFTISHIDTGSILFMGRIIDPR